ncbi:hypothetical protein Dsin_025679 [Dipteronia sinensis]|uniref:Uncharacterized protein n=1 Tax=Dipteronia sinensis TaxID=43782 RepID=A0AAD9ZXE5_9ROSI|nr:hypothetical protein Dsin_025679 [Dipteronia sinensis]
MIVLCNLCFLAGWFCLTALLARPNACNRIKEKSYRYKLKNIKETEAAKKLLQEKRLMGRTKSEFSLPSSYSADYFQRGRDYAEKLMRGHDAEVRRGDFVRVTHMGLSKSRRSYVEVLIDDQIVNLMRKVEPRQKEVSVVWDGAQLPTWLIRVFYGHSSLRLPVKSSLTAGSNGIQISKDKIAGRQVKELSRHNNIVAIAGGVIGDVNLYKSSRCSDVSRHQLSKNKGKSVF